ncbi:MAG: type I DNA topoisomerase [bacterium]
MGKSLIIVESPTKVKTIGKFLGSDYIIKASVGHIKDLPTSRLGVDVTQDFKPEYVTIKGKTKVIKEIKQAAEKADAIYLAPDPDREGEAIAWHLAEILKKEHQHKIYRLLFNEITRNGVQEALKHPRELNLHLAQAQQTRRILDRLVGYKISPLLWKKLKKGLSAGRVQSVALRMICDRQKEIQDFVKEEYWSITAHLEADEPPRFKAKLQEVSGKKAEIKNEEGSEKVLSQLAGQTYLVKKVTRKKTQRRPAAPFITSTLQQEAARKLNYSSKKTMMLAQKLYEGIDIGDQGQIGLITYMRTDSFRVSQDFAKEAREFIKKTYGQEYVPSKPPVYKRKKGIQQDAHEAVRPTSLGRNPDSLKAVLGNDLYRLYRLIWNRFIASQMKPAVLDTTAVDISAGVCLFRANGSIVTFPGFMSVYIEGTDDQKENGNDAKEGNILPPMQEGDQLRLEQLEPRQHFTQPPPYYTEATLIKSLEENGIGRPSTYATIVSTILAREYVRKEEKKLMSTSLGTMVTILLTESFPDIVNPEFTARMETSLDDIGENKENWVDSLHAFYSPFARDLEKAADNMRNIKQESTPTDLTCPKCSLKLVIKWGSKNQYLCCQTYPECPFSADLERDESNNPVIGSANTSDIQCEKCGKEMVIKEGRYGKFLACSGFPKCKNTKEYRTSDSGDIELQKPAETDEVCDKCQSPMVIKNGRYGPFLACSAYPKCKNLKPISIGVDCPDDGCNGYLTEKRGRSGKVFYSCSNYPDCKYSSWDKPVNSPCPDCGDKLLFEKKATKARPARHACHNKECGYFKEIA